MQDKKQHNVIFSSVLEGLMQRAGITQTQLASHLGMTQAAISNYLQGRVPNSKILLKLADYFNVTIDFLLTGPVNQKKTSEDINSGTNPALEPVMKCIQKSTPVEFKGTDFPVQNFPQFVHTAVNDYYALVREDMNLARQVAEIISVYRKLASKNKTPLP